MSHYSDGRTITPFFTCIYDVSTDFNIYQDVALVISFYYILKYFYLFFSFVINQFYNFSTHDVLKAAVQNIIPSVQLSNLTTDWIVLREILHVRNPINLLKHIFVSTTIYTSVHQYTQNHLITCTSLSNLQKKKKI